MQWFQMPSFQVHPHLCIIARKSYLVEPQSGAEDKEMDHVGCSLL